MEATKVVLHEKDLLMHLCEEVARKFVYVQNHTPYQVIKKKSPKEYFSGEKP